MTTGRVPSNRS